MLRPFPLRVLVLATVFALVAAACGDGGADTSTTVVAGAGTVDSGDDLVPLPSGLAIDEDPYSPVAATLTFDPAITRSTTSTIWVRNRQATSHQQRHLSISLASKRLF